MAEMLRLRIGDQAYFRALDGLAEELAGGLVSTQQLREAFEATSGSELADFFDYWIHGGFIPRLHLDYMVEDAGDGLVRVKGCYQSDVPFGTIRAHPDASSDSKPCWSDSSQSKTGGVLLSGSFLALIPSLRWTPGASFWPTSAVSTRSMS